VLTALALPLPLFVTPTHVVVHSLIYAQMEVVPFLLSIAIVRELFASTALVLLLWNHAPFFKDALKIDL